MVQIQNTDAITAIRDGAKLSISEGFPTALAPVCSPVMDMTPNFHRKTNLIKSAEATSTGAFTVHTASADRDTYLTGIALSFIKNATCDMASSSVTVTIVQGGITNVLVSIAELTLTAQAAEQNLSFSNPIKIDRGSIVQVTGTYTAGNMVRSCTLTGHEVESQI